MLKVNTIVSDELKSSSSSRTRRNRRKGKQLSGNGASSGSVSTDPLDWLTMSPKSLWKQIKDEAFSYFHFEMNVDTIDGVTEAFGLQKVSILRTFCVKTGVQVIWERLFTNVDTRNTVAPSYVESTLELGLFLI
jgi:protein TIF31